MITTTNYNSTKKPKTSRGEKKKKNSSQKKKKRDEISSKIKHHGLTSHQETWLAPQTRFFVATTKKSRFFAPFWYTFRLLHRADFSSRQRRHFIPLPRHVKQHHAHASERERERT